NVHPGKILSTSQEVDVEVLDVDSDKRRISLGLKQTMDNPWSAFLAEHPVGTEIEGEVRGITEFGLFVGLGPDLDGMVHINDIAWDKSGDQAIEAYNKGDMVRAKVLDVDIDKERISLGIKQLSGDPMEASDGGASVKRGATVTCTVTEVTSGGIEVEFGAPAIKSFIRRSDLSRDRADQRPERFAVGDKVDAKVIQVDRATRRVSLSIKALEIAEEAEAVAQYGSADAGASLGDILGAALASSGVGKGEAKAAPAADGDTGRLAGPQGDADDLKKIKGVGPAFEKKLNEAGIFHFWQIAGMTDEQLEALEAEVGTSGKGAEWKAQAEELQG
ncbi:MAG: S1 RNA-binding domain-containing protein, partial [Hyphomonas sp.]|nr:S1 RNA-binding domain-containing protein [Hyphomonas sp.]